MNFDCLEEKRFNDAMDSIYTISKDYSSALIGIRTLLQITGTEIGQSLNREIWPTILAEFIDDVSDDIDYVIVDDWRFLFEYYNVARNLPKCKLTPYFIYASESVRAKRRNISVDELKKQSSHVSERESAEVILNWMNIYFPTNIIDNGDNHEVV